MTNLPTLKEAVIAAIKKQSGEFTTSDISSAVRKRHPHLPAISPHIPQQLYILRKTGKIVLLQQERGLPNLYRLANKLEP